MLITDNRVLVSRAWAAIQKDRVDIIGLGDSNQVHGGDGWDHGFQYAMSKLGRMWATPLWPWWENAGNGFASGYKGVSSPSQLTRDAAPAQLIALCDELFSGSSYYQGDLGNTHPMGLYLEADNPIDVTANLKAQYYYGTFVSGTHTFNGGAITNPFSYTGADLPINCTTGSYGIAHAEMDIVADATRAGKQLIIRPTGFNYAVATAAFLAYGRVTNPSRTAGWSYTSMEYRGGQPTRRVANDLLGSSNDTLTTYFDAMRQQQGTTKRFIFVINEGLNDRIDALSSVGPAVVTSSTPAGYADNTTAIVERVLGIWRLNGWDQSEVYWVFMTSHPIADPDDAQLISYRTQAQRLATRIPQAVAIDLSELTTFEEMLANNWYSGPTDLPHLSQAGYEQLSVRVIDKILEDGGSSDLVSIPIGDIAVNHDTGGVDILRFTNDSGDGIDNADVRAYLKAEYDAGLVTRAHIKSQTKTGVVNNGTTTKSGRMPNPLYLLPGNTYAITFNLPGSTETVKVEVTI